MAMTEWIDNYPGFPEGIGGSELGELMVKQAQRFGAEVTYGNITSVTNESGRFEIQTDGETALCRAFVIATGATPLELGAPGESELRGRGVSYCAVCDGNFFAGQPVVVIGGGDSAVEEAVYLSKMCAKVTIIHRREKLRAKKTAVEAAQAKQNIEFALNSTVVEVTGDKEVTGVKIKNTVSGEISDVPCSGAFFYVGVAPRSEWARGIADTDGNGFIITDENMETSVKGIYAVGDVRRPRNRQVSTAVGDGAAAALAIERVLNEQPDRWRK